MKRFLCVMILVLFASAPALAQNQTPTSPDQPQPPKTVTGSYADADVAATIQKICKDTKTNCSVSSQVRSKWTGSFTDMPVIEAIATIAVTEGFEVEVVDNVVYVRPKPTQVERRVFQSTVPESRVGQPYSVNNPPTDPAVAAYCAQVSCDGMYPEQVAASMAMENQNRSRRAFQATYYDTGYGYDQGYNNPFGYALNPYTELQKYGTIKIDGPDRYLQKVRVVVDGRDASGASKANNRWNNPILLTAGGHTIRFVMMENGAEVGSFERKVDVIPFSAHLAMAMVGQMDRKEPTTWLRVSENEFAAALNKNP